MCGTCGVYLVHDTPEVNYADKYPNDTPAGMAMELLTAAAIDANKADPDNPQGAGKRLVSAIHMAVTMGIPFDEINDVVNGSDS